MLSIKKKDFCLFDFFSLLSCKIKYYLRENYFFIIKMQYSGKTTNMSLVKISGKCPICNCVFSFKVHEHKIQNAESHPVAFTTIHCDQALICYVDKNNTIRMVETGHLSIEFTQKNVDDAKILDISKLSIYQRTILESNIDKKTFQNFNFPNLVEK